MATRGDGRRGIGRQDQPEKVGGIRRAGQAKRQRSHHGRGGECSDEKGAHGHSTKHREGEDITGAGEGPGGGASGVEKKGPEVDVIPGPGRVPEGESKRSGLKRPFSRRTSGVETMAFD